MSVPEGYDDSPSPTPTAASAQDYDTAKSLVAALKAAGVRCADFRRLDQNQSSLADFGLCFLNGDHTYETDIYILNDPAMLQPWVDQFSDNEGIHVLAGANWFITSGSIGELEQIAGAIGGTIAY